MGRLCLLLLLITMLSFRREKKEGEHGQSIKSQMPGSNHGQCWHSALPFVPSSFSTCHPEGSFRNTNLILLLFPSFSPLQPHWLSSCSYNTQDVLWASALAVSSAWHLFPVSPWLVPSPHSGLCWKPLARKSISSCLPPSLSYTLPCFIILHKHYNNLIVYHLFICM